MQWRPKRWHGVYLWTIAQRLLLFSVGIAILWTEGGWPLLAATAQSKTEIQPQPSSKDILPPEPRAWAVAIATRGGVAGVAIGSIAVTSRGEVFVRAGCRGQLSAGETRRLDQIVSSAKPVAWKPNYPRIEGTAITDALQWSLTLRRRGAHGAEEVYRADWSDNSVERPDDLVALHRSIMKLKGNLERGCKM